MRKPIQLILTILVTMSLLGCGFFYSVIPISDPNPDPLPTPIATSPAQALPKLSGDWLVTLAQSGGIAGVSRSLEITSSGEMTINDIRTGEKKTSQLQSEKLVALGNLVAASTFHLSSQPSVCADCFIYNLQITSGGGDFQAEVDDVNLPDSGLQPVINYLAALLNDRSK